MAISSYAPKLAASITMYISTYAHSFNARADIIMNF